MNLTKLNSERFISVSTSSNIDWDKIISKPQKLVKDFLFQYWKNDNIIEEFYIPGSKLRLDLFNISKKVVVEISPDEYHINFNKFLHKDRFKFLDKVQKDGQKRDWCTRNGLKLAELYNEDLKNLSKELFEEKFNIYL